MQSCVSTTKHLQLAALAAHRQGTERPGSLAASPACRAQQHRGAKGTPVTLGGPRLPCSNYWLGISW